MSVGGELWRIFLCVYLSQTNNMPEARSQMPQRMTVLHCLLYAGIKERTKEDYRKVGENDVPDS